MASENETVAGIAREMLETESDDRASGFTWFRIDLLRDFATRICSAVARREEEHKREVAQLQRRLKRAEDALDACKNAMCNYCRSTPEAHGLPCVNGCDTLAMAKNALAAIRGEGGDK